jgi:7-cyano-7-deazaguanine reductase
MKTPGQLQLGRRSKYMGQYDATLLHPISRAPNRAAIGVQGRLPFLGADIWNAYELSWLNLRGKPQVALAQIVIPCETPHLVESKSFKLYLGSFSNTRMPDANAVCNRICSDINEVLWQGGGTTRHSSAHVKLVLPDAFTQESIRELDGLSMDRLDIECTQYTPAPELLRANFSEAHISETLCSQLLKSNCLVTGQPDWASVRISYSGPPVDHGGLLRYIVSFRNHHEFHEQCVERIYMDIMRRCKPTQLSVYARYTRRGGLDINPWRCSHPQLMPDNVRMARQ